MKDGGGILRVGLRLLPAIIAVAFFLGHAVVEADCGVDNVNILRQEDFAFKVGNFVLHQVKEIPTSVCTQDLKLPGADDLEVEGRIYKIEDGETATVNNLEIFLKKYPYDAKKKNTDLYITHKQLEAFNKGNTIVENNPFFKLFGLKFVTVAHPKGETFTVKSVADYEEADGAYVLTLDELSSMTSYQPRDSRFFYSTGDPSDHAEPTYSIVYSVGTTNLVDGMTYGATTFIVSDDAAAANYYISLDSRRSLVMDVKTLVGNKCWQYLTEPGLYYGKQSGAVSYNSEAGADYTKYTLAAKSRMFDDLKDMLPKNSITQQREMPEKVALKITGWTQNTDGDLLNQFFKDYRIAKNDGSVLGVLEFCNLVVENYGTVVTSSEKDLAVMLQEIVNYTDFIDLKPGPVGSGWGGVEGARFYKTDAELTVLTVPGKRVGDQDKHQLEVRYGHYKTVELIQPPAVRRRLGQHL